MKKISLPTSKFVSRKQQFKLEAIKNESNLVHTLLKRVNEA